MRVALHKRLATTALIAAVGGVSAGPLTGAAAADSVLNERRVADGNPLADARGDALLARAEAAPAPAVLAQTDDVAQASGDESAAVIVTDDPVARAPVSQRARGPPQG